MTEAAEEPRQIETGTTTDQVTRDTMDAALKELDKLQHLTSDLPSTNKNKTPAIQESLNSLLLTLHVQKKRFEAGFASEHDQRVSRKAAYVLCGGRLTPGALVSEQYLLDIEREAFLSLCGERKTQERIAHTLKTGKPLRN